MIDNIIFKVNNDLTIQSTDLGWVVKHVEIGSPLYEPKLVTVPGRNGFWDFSEALTGSLAYTSRKIMVQFLMLDKPLNQIQDFMNLVISTLQGKNIAIIVPSTSLYYHYGRAEISWKLTGTGLGAGAEITLSMTAQPFRYHVSINPSTIQGLKIDTNLIKKINPIITSTWASKSFKVPVGVNLLAHPIITVSKAGTTVKLNNLTDSTTGKNIAITTAGEPREMTEWSLESNKSYQIVVYNTQPNGDETIASVDVQGALI